MRAHWPIAGFFLVIGLAWPVAGADKVQSIAALKPAPSGERRVALVIGNSAYKTSPLRNPVRDARAMAKALAETGFAVTMMEDASQAGMRRAIRTFGDELARGGVGLFFYAGHGMQIRGKNFLIPVNADIEREDEVEDQAVDANLVLSKMDSAKNSLNVMILDACRNNPFQRSFRSAQQGLAQMDAPSGTLISFATAPGSVASDGDGENGLYTKHLLAAIRQPGLPVEQLFKQVRIGVTRETGDKQIPWESSSLKGDFYFLPPDPNAGAAQQKAAIEKAVGDAVKREQEKAAAERAAMQAEMKKLMEQLFAKQKAEMEEEMRQRAIAQGKTPPPPVQVAAAPSAAQLEAEKRQAELEAKQKEELAARQRAEAEARQRAQEEAKRTAELAAKQKAELEARLKAEQEARARAEAEAKRIADAAARQKAEQEVRARAEAEARRIAELEAKQKAELAARQKAEQEARLQAEAEARQRAEVEAKQKAEREALAKAAPKPAPVQLASVAPTAVAVAVSALPQPGDQWQYRSTNLYTKQTSELTATVKGASASGIVDEYPDPKAPGGASHWAWHPGAYIVGTRGFALLSPYLFVFEKPSPGQKWNSLPFQRYCTGGSVMDCGFDAKYVGRERVTVTAGTFDAHKVEIIENVFGTNWRVTRVITLWYAEEVKRYVKGTRRHSSPWDRAPEIDFELVSYKLQ